MTSSIESSAASASANKPQAKPARNAPRPESPGDFFGIDEAGYGPNLGPLSITVTRWRTPSAPADCNFYKLFSRLVDVKGHRDWKRLHIADSKLVNNGKDGFRSLETSALCLLKCLDLDISSFHAIRNQLAAASLSSDDEPLPWYVEDLPLPLAADAGQIEKMASRLCDRMHATGLQLLEIRSDLVVEDRFNRLTQLHASKGLTLSRLSFQLLRRLWKPETLERTLVVGDKHGGRNRYDELLAEVLDGEMIFRLQEHRQMSRYRIGQTELRFEVQGERYFPVAAASLISKYLRELAMEQLNRYWQRLCPDVRPTRGYPGDARRFREDVEAIRLRLQIELHRFWRER